MNGRRNGAETRAAAQRVAVELFSELGYDATSMRAIGERLGINKASLYYHFTNKEDIVRSIFEARADDAGELLEWVREHAGEPGLLDRAVLRWVGAASVDKLRGIRFMLANPVLARSLRASGAGIRDGLEAVAESVTPKTADATTRLLVRMAFLSINAAVAASAGTTMTDDDIVLAAREQAVALLARLGH